MRIIMPAVIFIGISNIAGMQKLIPMGHESSVTVAAWTGAAVDIVLNMLLIPEFASAGAAAATLATELIVMVFLLRAVKKADGKSLFRGTPVAGIALPAVLAMPACIPAAGIPQALPLRIIASGCCYLAVYIILILLIWRRNGLLRRNKLL
jgi:O-antigen/teichoic acid export membrane protein